MRSTRLTHRFVRHGCWGLPVHILCSLLATAAWADSGRDQVEPAKAKIHRAPRPLSSDATTQDWPTFLGARHDGVCRETHLEWDWDVGGPPLVWERETGAGYAGPSIAGGRLILHHAIGKEEIIDCLDPETGRLHWAVRYPAEFRDRYGYGAGPRSTPLIHDGTVYTLGVSGIMHAVALDDGTIRWTKDLLKSYDGMPGFFGIGTSPVMVGETLVVNIGGKPDACVVGLDPATGETRWKAGPWGASYATPVKATIDDRPVLFVLAGGESRPPVGGLLAIDPRSGQVDAEFPFRSERFESVNAATPVVLGDRVFISSSYRTGGAMLRFTWGKPFEVLWRNDNLRCHFATPIVIGDHLYGFDGMSSNDTALACVRVADGTQLWRKTLEWTDAVRRNGRDTDMPLTPGRGSLLKVADGFLCLGEMGHLLRLDMSPSGVKVIERRRLFLADETWTPPVISHGLLYVLQNRKDALDQTTPRIRCYDLRGR